MNWRHKLQCVPPALPQAEFYSWSIFGQGLNTTLLGRAQESDGGMKAQLSSYVEGLYTEVANEEINHVRKQACGPQPQSRLGYVFQ